MSDTIDLFSNEENELTFQLMIEGTTSDGSIDKPVVRFLIDEGNGGMAYMFPVTTDSKDEVSVVIPPMEKVVTEGKSYTGRLEVIIGNRHFVPTEMNVKFKKALRVESKAVAVSHKNKLDESSSSESAVEPTVSVGKVKRRATVRRNKTATAPEAKKRQYTPAQKKEILRRRKLAESAKTKDRQRSTLKAMLEGALDFDDD